MTAHQRSANPVSLSDTLMSIYGRHQYLRHGKIAYVKSGLVWVGVIGATRAERHANGSFRVKGRTK